MKQLLKLFFIPILLNLCACGSTVPPPPTPHWGNLIAVNTTIPSDPIQSRGSYE
ncbi:MAG: hypothetical protein KIT27_08395 [Legionellales bacterium]|nr:hypothetical protein [Legionellales bacterium]